MPAELVHLVRHGEVHNPGGVLYGRIEGFGLSDLGHRMAAAAADSLADRPVRALVASPLQRTRESAAPWADRFGLPLQIDERLIEPANRFEGLNLRRDLPRAPKHWPYLLNPWRPAWGEPFTSIAERMMAVVADRWAALDGGDLVLVSHQLPIWMVARTVADARLAHVPGNRRCSLSSITTLAHRDGRFVEVSYVEPARGLLAAAVDEGAV